MTIQDCLDPVTSLPYMAKGTVQMKRSQRSQDGETIPDDLSWPSVITRVLVNEKGRGSKSEKER